MSSRKAVQGETKKKPLKGKKKKTAKIQDPPKHMPEK